MKVLVIGDSCIDRFCYGDTRPNPEACSFVFKENYSTQNPGMAGNVAEHFKNLNIKYDFVTQKEQIIKTRYVDEKSNYILLRVDNENNVGPCKLKIDVKKYDFIVVSEYAKGFLTTEYLSYLINECQKYNKLIFIDTKKILGPWSHYAWVKINDKEFKYNIDNGAEINYDKTIITLGKDGAKYRDKIYKPKKEVEMRDAVGSGDSFNVFFALYFYKTNNIKKAIEKANYYAGISCSQRGVVSKF